MLVSRCSTSQTSATTAAAGPRTRSSCVTSPERDKSRSGDDSCCNKGPSSATAGGNAGSHGAWTGPMPAAMVGAETLAQWGMSPIRRGALITPGPSSLGNSGARHRICRRKRLANRPRRSQRENDTFMTLFRPPDGPGAVPLQVRCIPRALESAGRVGSYPRFKGRGDFIFFYGDGRARPLVELHAHEARARCGARPRKGTLGRVDHTASGPTKTTAD